MSTPVESDARRGLTERDAWVVLASVDGVGCEIFAALVAEHGGAAAVLEVARAGRLRARARASEDHDDAIRGPVLPVRVRAAIGRAAHEPARMLEAITAARLWTLTPLDAGYPVRLHDLDPPPVVLFGWGDPASLCATRSVAVVGTRRPTLAGRDLAARVATRLVACRAVVVSGLAFGIDGAAHAATVDAGGVTVAVIGGGHDEPGPRAHAALRAGILARGGAIVSELPPHASATRGTFPRRNRIIAALADATIVLEAPRRSGALITARHALELGGAVFAAPGRPLDPSTRGCLDLLRETPTRALVGLDELVVDLGFDRAERATEPRDGTAARLGARAALSLLGPAERAVAQRLRRGPASTDDLIEASGLPPATVSGALTLLLLRGWARALGAAYLPAGPLVVEDPP